MTSSLRTIAATAIGDRVGKGAGLLEVETEKATVAIEAPAAGVVTEIRVQAGDVVAIGAFVGSIED